MGVFSGVKWLLQAMMILCVLFVPLGLWKAIELLIWLFGGGK